MISRRRNPDLVKPSMQHDLVRAILDALPDPAILLDRDDGVVGANAAYTRLPSARREDGPARAVTLGDGTRAEPAGTSEAQRWLAWEERGMPIGGRAYRLRRGRDVTGQVEAERALAEARGRAEAAMEARTRGLAAVTHEFRTPLNGILGMAGLLSETGLTAEQSTYVQAVRCSAEAFLTLVDDILDLSRIEAGRIDLTDEVFDLPTLVQGVVELLAPRAQGKGTDIACFIGRDVPRFVRGDADRLRQVLMNLAGNAVKFTEAGGVGVAVERREGDVLRLSVGDTGPGIEPDLAGRIFEAFEQGEAPGSGERGTGLGLAITRSLVDRMGGTIGLDSRVGAGSRFHVDLALPKAAPDEDRPERPVRSVLILSASPFAGAYLARTLTEAGSRAVVVATLDEALARMGSERFDVVVGDHSLRDADIRAMAREARRQGSRSIVLLSPFERREFGAPHAAGFDAFLIKPVRARSLFERLAAAPPAPAAAPAVAGRDRPTALPRWPGRRVLLAEDNEVNALLAVRTLERLGAVVEWVRDGRAALARLEGAISGRDLAYDLVLMDIHMPGLDGRTVTRRIRAQEREAGLSRRIRILAVTASLGRDPVPVGPDDAFDGYLPKPFTLEALAAEMGDALVLASAS